MKIVKKSKRLNFKTGEFEYSFTIDLLDGTLDLDEFIYGWLESMRRNTLIPMNYFNIESDVQERR